MSHDADREASKDTATDRRTSVRSQNQTAILESGQQKGVKFSAGNPTEKLDSVSREADKDCGPGEDVSTCEVLNIHDEKHTQIRYIVVSKLK
jgi:hypothetical protein